jgi:hypothetical protein
MNRFRLFYSVARVEKAFGFAVMAGRGFFTEPHKHRVTSGFVTPWIEMQLGIQWEDRPCNLKNTSGP